MGLVRAVASAWKGLPCRIGDCAEMSFDAKLPVTRREAESDSRQTGLRARLMEIGLGEVAARSKRVV